MRRARLHKPYRGYTNILVDMDSITGGWHGYQYRCVIEASGAEISCYDYEFEFLD